MASAGSRTLARRSTTRSSMSRGLDARPKLTSGSARIARTVMRGSRLLNGSWKTICISLRSGRSADDESVSIRRPRNRTSPAVGSISRSTSRPRVDFPHPLSPTIDRVSPAPSTKSTPSTAATWPRALPRKVRRTGKCFFRPRTSRSGASIMPRPCPRGDRQTPGHSTRSR